tara:strand:+ start:3140 stop:3631 length:492 start_codon:yes stop_codon:yes gene_type:complete
MGYTRSGEGYAIPFSDAARKKAADTADYFAEARKRRRTAEAAGTAMPTTPAPVGDVAASIQKQNEAMGIKPPAQAGGAAQAVPQNQPPIQGAGQQPPVGARRRRGATDAPFSKTYLEGQAATKEWFDTANRNRQDRMAREAEQKQKSSVRIADMMRKISQINR